MKGLLGYITSSLDSIKVELSMGDSLILEGELLKDIVFIEEGSLILSKNSRSILIRKKHEAADFFHLFHEEYHSFYEIIASTDLSVRLFNRDKLKLLLMGKPELLSLLTKQVLNQLIDVEQMIQIQRETSKTKRILMVLLHVLKDNSSHSFDQMTETNLKWIASLSNVSLRFAKKIINKLEQRDLVLSEPGKMTVTEIDALKLIIKKEDFL